ncbi:unnamed protein product [Parnassius mnemosyne]|uniref:Uncharacterized protein n=1 Tax=Parnassius mnemosyne TaxID=213953 RepID=A0AAV1LFB1_9NEOP
MVVLHKCNTKMQVLIFFLWLETRHCVIHWDLCSVVDLYWAVMNIMMLITFQSNSKSGCKTWPCHIVERRIALEKSLLPTFKRSILECVEESAVSPNLVLQITAGNWNVREEYKLKAWALCLLLKSNMISKEGVFHLDVALAGVPDIDKNTVEKKIDECLYSKERKPEDIAWHFLKCYHQGKPRYSYM